MEEKSNVPQKDKEVEGKVGGMSITRNSLFSMLSSSTTIFFG